MSAINKREAMAKPMSANGKRMRELQGFRFYNSKGTEIPKYQIVHSKLNIDNVLAGKAGIRVVVRPRYEIENN